MTSTTPHRTTRNTSNSRLTMTPCTRLNRMTLNSRSGNRTKAVQCRPPTDLNERLKREASKVNDDDIPDHPNLTMVLSQQRITFDQLMDHNNDKVPLSLLSDEDDTEYESDEFSHSFSPGRMSLSPDRGFPVTIFNEDDNNNPFVDNGGAKDKKKQFESHLDPSFSFDDNTIYIQQDSSSTSSSSSSLPSSPSSLSPSPPTSSTPALSSSSSSSTSTSTFTSASPSSSPLSSTSPLASPAHMSRSLSSPTSTNLNHEYNGDCSDDDDVNIDTENPPPLIWMKRYGHVALSKSLSGAVCNSQVNILRNKPYRPSPLQEISIQEINTQESSSLSTHFMHNGNSNNGNDSTGTTSSTQHTTKKKIVGASRIRIMRSLSPIRDSSNDLKRKGKQPVTSEPPASRQ